MDLESGVTDRVQEMEEEVRQAREKVAEVEKREEAAKEIDWVAIETVREEHREAIRRLKEYWQEEAKKRQEAVTAIADTASGVRFDAPLRPIKTTTEKQQEGQKRRPQEDPIAWSGAEIFEGLNADPPEVTQTRRQNPGQDERQDQVEAEYTALVETLRAKGLTKEADEFQALWPRLLAMAPHRFVRPIPAKMHIQGYWKNMKPNERSVYLELLYAADRDTGSSFLKRETLAKQAKVGMTTLKGCITLLTKKGLLESREVPHTIKGKEKYYTHRRLRNAGWAWRQEPWPAGTRPPGGTRTRLNAERRKTASQR